ncbi:MAG: hypothetical protein E4H27_07180 [Anaerolineales bacterium]|nr:MAG: hypothetical protein E4H27_07180 [Anaerolineales bacterium]
MENNPLCSRQEVKKTYKRAHDLFWQTEKGCDGYTGEWQASSGKIAFTFKKNYDQEKQED